MMIIKSPVFGSSPSSSTKSPSSFLQRLVHVLVVVVFFLGCHVAMVTGHRPATAGPSCDNDYGSSTRALPLPDPTISWSFRHYLDCTHRAVWISTVNTAGPNQPFYVGVGVPPADRFGATRANALIIGPGLPALTEDEWASIPDSIRQDPVWNTSSSTTTMGAYFHQSPQDQSTCNHLGTVMQGESTVVNGRCDFYEPFGRTHSWRVLDADNNLLVEENETYYVAVFLQDDTSAKIGIALGTWVENFITPYEIDTPTCTRTLEDFSEKDGSQEECFPVVSCPAAERPIGCESLEGEQQQQEDVCEQGQVCETATTIDDENTAACVIAGMEYTPPTMGACGGERCPAAVAIWEQINFEMHKPMMDLEYTGNAKIDFVRGMIPHHNGAVDMCQGLLQDLTCTKVDDIDNLEGLVHFCNHIQLEQEIEVGGMRAWLAWNNLTELAPCSATTSSNQDISVTRQQENYDDMGGSMGVMESCGNLTAPSSQKLIEVNHKMHDKMSIQYSCDHSVDFVRMMLPHHAAAVEMCDILVMEMTSMMTEDDFLMELCDNITLTQRAEIAWMFEWLQARDHSPIAPCGGGGEDCATTIASATASAMTAPCEDTLSTSSFCHGISGQVPDGYCRCDEDTLAANNYTCDEPTWVDGVGLFLPQVFCKRTCGMCPSDSRPLWMPGCNSSSSSIGHTSGHDDHNNMDHDDHNNMEHDEMMTNGTKNGEEIHTDHDGSEMDPFDEGASMLSEGGATSGGVHLAARYSSMAALVLSSWFALMAAMT